jgi:plastocyanin
MLEKQSFMKISRSVIILVVIVVVIIIAAAIVLTSPKTNNSNVPSDTNHVSITSAFSFDPPSLTIHVGDNVTWTNNANTVHTVSSDSGSNESFLSPALSKGDTYTHQFNKIGTFTYHCSIHPSMTGTIIVIE